jgi:hypothetical protein
MTYFITRDLVVLIGILVGNILILRVISQMVKTRLELFRNDGGEENATVKATLKAEKKKMIMILLTGVNYFAGHSINLVFQVFLHFDSQNSLTKCFAFLQYIFLTLSYATSFFFYYFFNKRFKQEINSLVLFSFARKTFKSVLSSTTATTRG